MRTEQFMPALRRELRNDGLIYGLIALHVAVAVGCGAAFDRLDHVHLLEYTGIWLKIFLIVLPNSAALILGFYLVWTRSPSPLQVAVRLFRRHVDARVVAGLVLVTALTVFMGAFTSLKNLAPAVRGFPFDAALADLDRTLHGADAWRLLPEFLWSRPVLRAIEINYSVAWMFYAFGTACAVAVFVHDRRLRNRFMICFLTVWSVLGNGMAAFFSSAGPAFFRHVAGDGERFGALLDRLSVTSEANHSAVGFHDLLWRLHEQSDAAIGSGISAFPSIHVAVAALCCLTAYEIDRRLGRLALVYLLLTLVSSVVLGWHYALDGYASIAAVAAIFYGVKAAATALSREPAAAPAALAPDDVAEVALEPAFKTAA